MRAWVQSCRLEPAGQNRGQAAAARFSCTLRARAAPLPQVGFSSCLGGDGSLPLTDPIARSFLVASSPLLDPRSTAIGRLGGGFVPWRWPSLELQSCCGCLAQAVIRDNALWLPQQRPPDARSRCHDQELPADSSGSRRFDGLPKLRLETYLRASRRCALAAAAVLRRRGGSDGRGGAAGCGSGTDFRFNGVLPVAFCGLSGPFKLPSRACKKSWCVGGDVMSSDSSGGRTRWPGAGDLWPVDSRTPCQLLA